MRYVFNHAPSDHHPRTQFRWAIRGYPPCKFDPRNLSRPSISLLFDLQPLDQASCAGFHWASSLRTSLISGIASNRRCDMPLIVHHRIIFRVPNSAGQFGVIRRASSTSGIRNSRRSTPLLILGRPIIRHIPIPLDALGLIPRAISLHGLHNGRRSILPLIFSRQINHYIPIPSDAWSLSAAWLLVYGINHIR